MDKVIAIVGPTAVGKTALSLALAKKLQAPLISGDAYQIYRHMNIGTAKPSAAELAGHRHYLIDIAEPGEPYSAALFCAQAKELIRRINAGGKIPVLVGGTGLYVQSLLEGYDFSAPSVTTAQRAQARQRIASLGETALRKYIIRETAWEPADWHELLANTNRLVRLVAAIEHGEGKKFVRAGKANGLVYDAYVIGLSLPQFILYQRIEQRIDRMIAAGWQQEAAYLLRCGYGTENQAMKAIGYEELAACIQGTLSLPHAIANIKTRTRRFAKRQWTWYRRMPYIHWFDKTAFASETSLVQTVWREVTAFFCRKE